MNLKNSREYLVLASSCQVVEGAKRSVIIDHGTGALFFISDEYVEILNHINRQPIQTAYKLFDDESSATFFEEFVNYLVINNLAFLTGQIDAFPQRSTDGFEEDVLTKIYNCILEIDADCFDVDRMQVLSSNLHSLRCKDVQIRFLSCFDNDLLRTVLSFLEGTTVNYVEVHCAYVKKEEIKQIEDLVSSNRLINHFFVYDWSVFDKKEIKTDDAEFFSLELGTIYFLKYPFEEGGCCGRILFETLEFSNIDLHHKLKKTNGCLDRKVTIDRYGNIKNCPSRPEAYGNIKEVSLTEILSNPDFKKWWFIHKDQIEVCRDCEFRYNCTDCRAFLEDAGNIYSKPLKCGYNPYSNVWEDWSTNALKDKRIVNLTENV